MGPVPTVAFLLIVLLSSSAYSQSFSALVARSTQLLDAGELSQAERVLQQARELLSQPPDPASQAEIIDNMVGIHLRLGRYVEAEKESREGLHLIENLPSAYKLVPYLLDSLAAAEIYQGKYTQALIHQNDAIDRFRAFLPEDHPDMIKGNTVLATAQYMTGEYKGAHQSLETAITGAQHAFGKQSPEVARLLQNELIVLNRLKLKNEIKVRQRELSRIPLTNPASPETFTRSANAPPTVR